MQFFFFENLRSTSYLDLKRKKQYKLRHCIFALHRENKTLDGLKHVDYLKLQPMTDRLTNVSNK